MFSRIGDHHHNGRGRRGPTPWRRPQSGRRGPRPPRVCPEGRRSVVEEPGGPGNSLGSGYTAAGGCTAGCTGAGGCTGVGNCIGCTGAGGCIGCTGAVGCTGCCPRTGGACSCRRLADRCSPWERWLGPGSRFESEQPWQPPLRACPEGRRSVEAAQGGRSNLRGRRTGQRTPLPEHTIQPENKSIIIYASLTDIRSSLHDADFLLKFTII